MTDETRVERSKFELGRPPAAIDAGELPWGYGENRITAIVRDPDSAYVYWEITDEGIAGARKRLGPAGADGWCNLRVYDTTGRDFDGTNANHYFDVRVDRADREHYFMIRRPTATMHVEIGIKTHEGFFQAIARSGRAEFPRSWPSPNGSVDWMTVTSDGAPPCVAPYRSRFAGQVPPLPTWVPQHDVWESPVAYESAGEVHTWQVDEWRTEWRGGLRFVRWVGPADASEEIHTEWREGPVSIELVDPERIVVELLGELPVHFETEGTELIVYGPWKVTIRSSDATPRRRVLSEWSVRWVKATTPMIERWGWVVERQRVAGYEREVVMQGASEQRTLLERGASERWRLGASERMWMGASEWAARGGSETLFAGASQWVYGGASALLYRGASERIGASERWRSSLGGSEWFGGSAWVGGSAAFADPPRESYAERWTNRPDDADGALEKGGS